MHVYFFYIEKFNCDKVPCVFNKKGFGQFFRYDQINKRMAQVYHTFCGKKGNALECKPWLMDLFYNR